MKKIIVACGSGIATSTILNSKLTELLENNNVQFELVQCSINEIESYLSDADMILSSMKLTQDFKIPCLNGIAYLTGIGEEALNESILKVVK